MGATAQLDDEQLYEAWIQGEERAGRELISRRFMGVRRVIASLLPASEVDDAVQDVFVRLTARAKQGQPIQAIKQFTAGVARNVVHERLRAKTRQPLDLSAHSIADILPLQSARMVMHEEQRLLLKGLHRLPVDDQILLGLRYWEQLRTRELAAILGSNHNTVRAQLRRAQLRLVQIVAGLADSPEAAQSTFGSFDGWAKDMRGRVDEPT